MASLTDGISDDVRAYRVQNGGYLTAEVYSVNDVSDEDIWAVAHILGDASSGAITVHKRPPATDIPEPT